MQLSMHTRPAFGASHAHQARAAKSSARATANHSNKSSGGGLVYTLIKDMETLARGRAPLHRTYGQLTTLPYTDKTSPTRRQARWVEFMLRRYHNIEHSAEKLNMADGLSCRPNLMPLPYPYPEVRPAGLTVHHVQLSRAVLIIVGVAQHELNQRACRRNRLRLVSRQMAGGKLPYIQVKGSARPRGSVSIPPAHRQARASPAAPCGQTPAGRRPLTRRGRRTRC